MKLLQCGFFVLDNSPKIFNTLELLKIVANIHTQGGVPCRFSKKVTGGTLG